MNNTKIENKLLRQSLRKSYDQLQECLHWTDWHGDKAGKVRNVLEELDKVLDNIEQGEKKMDCNEKCNCDCGEDYEDDCGLYEDPECPAFDTDENTRIEVWIVETWSHAMYFMGEGESHEVYFTHIASSKDEALEFCTNNSDFCGNQDNWHWRIHPRTVDEDIYNTVGAGFDDDEHFTRHGVPCNVNGFRTDPEEKEYENVDDAKEDLLKIIDNHSKEMKDIIHSYFNKFMEKLESKENA